MNKRKTKEANEFFEEESQARELEDKEIETGVHLNYRDGFRLGFGFFVGFAAASLIVILIAYLITLIFKIT